MAHSGRPLSPHLQVYRPQITSVMSIMHRLTGLALAGGLALTLWWLVALAQGPAWYGVFMNFAGGWIGRLIMLGFTWALFYHLCNGIRHLGWDVGRGFEMSSVRITGYLTLIGSLALTVGAWFMVYWAGV